MRDKNQLLLSIIVPVYNAENYIVRCLSSLANQTEKRIEIILIDDGSQDKSGILCDEFAMKHSELNVKVFVECAEINGADIVIGDHIIDKDDEKKTYVPVKGIMAIETALEKMELQEKARQILL